MSRTKLILAMTGITVAAAAAGCAAGLMFAPASGRELRRRLAWKTGEWRSMAGASARLVERAAARAREELRHRKEEWTGAAVSEGGMTHV
jgi:gas vesicle protein